MLFSLKALPLCASCLSGCFAEWKGYRELNSSGQRSRLVIAVLDQEVMKQRPCSPKRAATLTMKRFEETPENDSPKATDRNEDKNQLPASKIHIGSLLHACAYLENNILLLGQRAIQHPEAGARIVTNRHTMLYQRIIMICKTYISFLPDILICCTLKALQCAIHSVEEHDRRPIP